MIDNKPKQQSLLLSSGSTKLVRGFKKKLIFNAMQSSSKMYTKNKQKKKQNSLALNQLTNDFNNF